MKRKMVRKTISLLLAAAMTLALAGCSQKNAGDGQEITPDGTVSDTDTNSQTQDKTTDNADGQTAMGRYVEEEVDLSEQLGYPVGLYRRDDGALVILDNSKGRLVSKDEGKTWEAEEMPDWWKEIRGQKLYISNMAMSPDGTISISYDPVGDDDDYTPVTEVITPDGTRTTVELPLTEDEQYIYNIIMTSDNRIIANTVSANLYEINKDGSGELLLSAQERPYWFSAGADILVMDNDADNTTMPMLYDMKAGEYIEDDVLADFVHENYHRRWYNGFYEASMYMLPTDEQVIYLIGAKGIHRHVIGGNMMEQIVDGSLSLLSNPDYTIVSAMQLEGDVFLVLFSNGKLLRFTYDPNVPTVPDNMVVIYSLNENDSIRQSISYYQSTNPDVFVSYEVGMEAGGSVTREDAIKKLNTEIMAGTGPDLIIMDGLPLSSYAQKGLLLDMTDYFREYSASSPLFDNIIEALKIDGKAYVAPATISLPKIIQREEMLAGMKNLSGIADAVEKLREEYPGDDIIGICNEEVLLKRFAPVSEPLWVTENGTVAREIIKEYLEQCKRIYDAQMDGIPPELIQRYSEINERYIEYYGQSMSSMNWRMTTDLLDYIAGDIHFCSGWLEDYYSYSELTSVHTVKGYEDSKAASMQGQCGNVFLPNTMLGISAASKQIDAAKEFMNFFLSAQAGEGYYGLPLNQEAFDKQFTAEEGALGENGEFGTVSVSSADGLASSYTFCWPGDEQIAELKRELASVNTAYLCDEMLEGAVFKQGGAYIKGEISLESALDEIEKQVAIYMAE